MEGIKMTTYKLSWSKENECNVHLLETDEMVMDICSDVARFMDNEDLQSEYDFDINTVDDYSVNGFYLCGSDLIDYMREEVS